MMAKVAEELKQDFIENKDFILTLWKSQQR